MTDETKALAARLRESRTEWENARWRPTDLEREAADALDAQAARIAVLEAALAPLATEKQCRCMYISRDTERAYENGYCPHQVARAALASGATPPDDVD